MAETTLSLAQVKQRQTAAVKHGLYARAKPTLRQRNYRVGRLLRSLRAVAPVLTPADEPLARRWCQLEILATDAFAALLADQDDEKLEQRFLALSKTSLQYSRELGLTPSARAHLVGSLSTVATARAAQDRLRAKVARHVNPAEGSGT